jgi:hypothetical protein
MQTYWRAVVWALVAACCSGAAHGEGCEMAEVVRAYERALRQPPRQTFEAEQRKSVEGGRISIRRSGKSTLVERVDHGESGERARRMFLLGKAALFEDGLTTYFFVNHTPDARLPQTRVVNRVVACNGRLFGSGPLVGNVEERVVAREVLAGIAAEPSVKKQLSPGTLESLERVHRDR